MPRADLIGCETYRPMRSQETRDKRLKQIRELKSVITTAGQTPLGRNEASISKFMDTEVVGSLQWTHGPKGSGPLSPEQTPQLCHVFMHVNCFAQYLYLEVLASEGLPPPP